MIKVFKKEIDAGLESLVKESSSIAYLQITPNKSITIDEVIGQLQSTKANANPNQIDLFYFESILASVGWNLNDDVFDPVELWKARSTAIDKPVNFMHKDTDIIGHMTSAKVIGPDGAVLADDIDISSLPSSFDVVVGSVLYKYWEDKDQLDRVQKLIAEIQEGKWCVSMECIFPHFDYAVVTPDGLHKVIARTEETSFLTSHLKMYKGSGEYQGHKLGRLLRNFTFNGKGIVDNPANPRSDITTYSNKNEVSAFAGTAASINILVPEEKPVMADELKYTESQYKALESKIEALTKEQVEKEVASAKASVEATEQKLKTVATELDAKKEIISAHESTIAKLTKDLEASVAEVAQLKEEAKVKAQEIVKASRLSVLLGKGVEEAKAQSYVEKFALLSDELFTEFADAIQVKAKCDDSAEEDAEKKKMEKEKAEKAAAELAKTQASEGSLAVPPVENNGETVLKAAASWIQNNLAKKQ